MNYSALCNYWDSEPFFTFWGLDLKSNNDYEVQVQTVSIFPLGIFIHIKGTVQLHLSLQ